MNEPRLSSISSPEIVDLLDLDDHVGITGTLFRTRTGETTVRVATELISTVPPWLQADHDSLTAKVLRLPERDEIDSPISEQLIVELYSK